ncbi:exodeoxyribonuclease VII small subunit [Roseibacillus persicicus]|uniref:Exodeoxyribonuclease 7 small subunit n=1 Tax=Roseibacillus persicicus TaxID=454148 RepID=A0A918TTZ2_9BACT|nr:exodeoxyribonuclease VII small subunit [Roseibacillus persicicus]MDQ8188713.1 exodeoxyribonuclease VII small subunit [Roseibacillus persicicus]GHC63249.1 hypothetical protein GCM10007100_33480 [Roseibacillus persicicus]
MAKKNSKLPPFEEALEKLEGIVNLMETESLPLEALLNNYEDGHELIAHCQGLLQNARERIDIVHMNDANNKAVTENKLASESTSSDTLPSEAASDDTRLL